MDICDKCEELMQQYLDGQLSSDEVQQAQETAANRIPKVVPHAAALKGVVQALTPEGQNGARKMWTWEWAA